MTDRTPADYAIEHAEYLATNAVGLLAAIGGLLEAQQAYESGDGSEEEIHAGESNVSEAMQAVREGIYEFRKRRDRALATPAPAQPDPLHVANERGEGWQPIETAPERGIILLGLAPNEEHEDGYVSPGYWMESDEDGPDNMGHDAGFVDVHFNFFSCARSFGNPTYQHKGLQPTHWMPLPAAPKEKT